MPQPQKHIRARIIRIVIALVLVAAAVCTLPLPWRVNRELEGYRWTRGNVVQPMTVRVDGWYLRFLLRENLFYGWFYMDGIPYMRTLHRWIEWDDNWFEDTDANLCTTPVYDEVLRTFRFDHYFWERDAFRQVVGRPASGTFKFAAPAATPDEAKALFVDLIGADITWPEWRSQPVEPHSVPRHEGLRVLTVH